MKSEKMENDGGRYFIFLTVAFFAIILFSSYTLFSFYKNTSKNPVLPNPEEESYCMLHNNDTVLSFEIDDITFTSSDAIILENALFLAQKYGITFDLGVIAKPFNESMDPDTLSIYQNNRDFFEIVAHGYTHLIDPSVLNMYSSNNSYGEFYTFNVNQNVPTTIQESHIRSMKEVFKEYNIKTATEIFTVPYHTGDFNTTLLAMKYGYRLIIQKITTPKVFSEVRFGNITDTQNYIDIPEEYNGITRADISNYTAQINAAIKAEQKKIDISLHPINFQNFTDINNFFGQTLPVILQNNTSIRFDFLSDRFNC